MQTTIDWFASLGVDLKCEEIGKLFPVTDKARSVLNAPVDRCRELGVVVRTNYRVGIIERAMDHDHGFVIHHSQGVLHARKVVLVTGGQSIPKSGSDGFGYSLA